MATATTHHLSLPLLLSATCAALLIAPGALEGLRFAPAAGTVLEKEFETRLRLELSDFVVLFSGADPGEFEPVLRIESHERVRVVDRYAGSEAGRPTSFERRYEEIALEADFEQVLSEEGATGEGTARGSSELSGAEVRFEWADGSWSRSWADEERDDELLAGLAEDMDLRVLLPGEDVEPGAEWRPDPSAFLRLLAPGGELAMEIDYARPEGDPRFLFVGLDAITGVGLRPYLQGFDGDVDGEVTATHAGRVEHEGREAARVELEFDLDLEHDSSELWSERWLDSAMADEVELTMDEATTRIELSGRGELVWDVESGHLLSLELDGDLVLSLDMAFEAVVGEETMEVESTLELSGSFEQRVQAE